MAGLCETLRRAATLLEEEAASLKACHTVRGKWSSSEDEVRAIYDEHRHVAATLREAAKYHFANPLGGPAKVFDAIADMVRAGDSLDSAMAVFGVKWADAGRKRPNAEVSRDRRRAAP